MRRITWILLAVLATAATAHAYVLPSTFLLRLLADKRKDQKIEDLSVQMHTDRAAEGDTVEAHVYLKRPAKLRRVEEGAAQYIYVENRGKRAAGTADALKRLSGPTTDFLALLLVPDYTNTDAMVEQTLGALKAVGVDTSITSFGRDERKVVYIIGARSWEQDKPQLWLDKSTYLPVRVRGQVKENGQQVTFETRLLEWGSSVAGNWFPRVIEEYRNGELVRRSEVTEVKLNQNLPESMFDIP